MYMKEQFDKRLTEIVNKKPGNKMIYSRATYDKIVNNLLRAHTKSASSAGYCNFKRLFERLIHADYICQRPLKLYSLKGIRRLFSTVVKP
ncbi:hypothetical protein T12_15996 [Trichinella patagoniensis]|uniref:Uncharacterized protein n=1 Tax=Trichinella patagoniensis TaxID=990121 RepID=A0A0V0ZP34_9BILA|nr:hypothetical protein T12_15996 [Trichinella patagoniensis]